jgi:enolase
VNRNVIKRSIKAFIRENEDDLVDGLSSGGTPKRIAQITTAHGTEARQRIFIGIECATWADYVDATQFGGVISYAHVATKAFTAEYYLGLHVADYAVVQRDEVEGGDYERYETDTETFETFCARLVDLFRKETAITASTGNFTIEVFGDGGTQDRRIDGRDLSQRYTDNQGVQHELLYELISFRVGTCGEPYPLSRS